MNAEKFMAMCQKSRDEINEMFESGMFNSILKGYLIRAMKADHSDTDIRATLRVLDDTLDFTSAEEARTEWELFPC